MLMNHIAVPILDIVKAHPEWAMVLIGLTAFGESFVFVSLLFPGTAVLVAAGGLIAAGVLDPFQVTAAGILGESWEMRRHSGWDKNSVARYRNYGPSAGILTGLKAESISSNAMALSASSWAVLYRSERRCRRRPAC